MNLQFKKKYTIVLISVVILSVLLYTGAYFLYISPLKESLASKGSQLKMEQQLSKTLESRLSTAASDFNSTVELQKTLPADPMTEQFVLDLEKAEVISNSFISAMEFNNEDKGINEEQAINGDPQTTDTESDSQDTETMPESNVQPIKLPEGVEKTSVTVIVESENYFGLEKFISTMENLQRIVMVDSISFSGPEEITSLSDEEKKISMTLKISAFYLSGFDELKADSPKIETPAPANKQNPFPTFGDYSEDHITETDQPPEAEAEGTNGN